MSWQDIVLTIGQFAFMAALIPSLRSEEKPAIGTSLMTASVLFIFAVVNASLELYFAAVTVSLTGALWLVLAWQQWRKPRLSK